MAGSVVFYDAWTNKETGSFTLKDGEPYVISGTVNPSVFHQRVADYANSRVLTADDGEAWLRALPETYRGYIWGIYVPEQPSDEGIRSSDPGE
jgi:hypothetical protein